MAAAWLSCAHSELIPICDMEIMVKLPQVMVCTIRDQWQQEEAASLLSLLLFPNPGGRRRAEAQGWGRK